MRNVPLTLKLALGLTVLAGMGVAGWVALHPSGWNAEQRETLQSLSIDRLPNLPRDPSNKVADDPRAVKLGHQLFFDARLSANGQVSCASCHQAKLAFTDGLPLAKGVGRTNRKTMTVIGTAYAPFLFWDGRKDSLWAQALGPLESAVEHGGDRTMYAKLIAKHYKSEYEALFGPLPDLNGLPDHAGPVRNQTANANWNRLDPRQQRAITRVYANMGKAIAAYERRLVPGASRFDQYVRAVVANDPAKMRATFTPQEERGLRLFIGKANCTNCHNGPLLTNNDFHNTGIPQALGVPADHGRADGAKQVLRDEFNCLSPYSDATPRDCAPLRFLKADGEQLERAFKPPSLRNVALSAPYMHSGQKATLHDVLEHYNTAPAAPSGHSELHPLHLRESDLADLEAFLRTLNSTVNAPAQLLQDPFQSH